MVYFRHKRNILKEPNICHIAKAVLNSKIMAAGTSSLLRARRKDIGVKPNRRLDQKSSRGMIYENEELRLRTININAEVERSQSDIKKLRRENDVLRREIWTLRDECDRLVALVRQKVEFDDDAEEEDDEDESDEEEEEGGETNQEEKGEPPRLPPPGVDVLSVVPEEPGEETASFLEQHEDSQMPENLERQCEMYESTLPPLLRVNSVNPFTLACTLDPIVFSDVKVPEVIEAANCGKELLGVRLLPGSVYLSCLNQKSLENVLAKGITLRGYKLELEDVSQGTVIVSLSGVPHDLPEDKLAHTLSQFGPIIGYIERRFYRSVDTGERLARLRPISAFPKRFYVNGHEINLRTLLHEEVIKLATLPSRIVRTNLHVRLQTPTTQVPVSTPLTATPITRAHPFTYPPGNVSSTTTNQDSDRSHQNTTASNQRSPKQSRRKLRQAMQRRGNSPSSSSEVDFPGKPQRRKSLNRRDSIYYRRDQADSEHDSVASFHEQPRRLSINGRDEAKVPWCGCWGNGCL